MPNIFLFCLGIAKIAFQLDAVKVAIELILRIQTMTKVPSACALLGESPEKASDRVGRLRLVQGNLVFIGYGSQFRFERNKWFQS